jgi:T-complex protein 1 subunit zeta
LIESERALVNQKCQKICDFKKEVCKNGEGFVLINQKGIDPICLEMLAKENILGLRRAKRRNMERLMLSVGGRALNSVDEMKVEDLGYADHVSQEVLGEDKYTFVEGCKNPKSCTLLLKGPDQHTIAQLKDAIRDGLRAVKNTLEDQCVIPGGGAFEVYCSEKLLECKGEVMGKAKLGYEAYAESLLTIPKVLA